MRHSRCRGPHLTRSGRLLAAVVGTAALATLASACLESVPTVVERSTGPIERSELPDFYTAISMVSTDAGGTTDLLASGATLSLTLGENSALSGRLFIPGGAADGSDLDADMTGAWTFDPIGQTVRFVQQADTFVRDAEFDASRDGFAILLTGSSVPADAPAGTPGIEVTLKTAG